MKIIKLEPQGYCGGVKAALHMVYRALEDPSFPRPIYLLGAIIHNRQVTKDLTDKGIILLDSSSSRLEMLQKIEKGTVVFSAHGVSPAVYELAQKKGLFILDTTCKNVLIIHKKIENYLKQGYTCLYIGTKNHPECEGVLGIHPSIHHISTVEDIENLTMESDKIYVTNQTTLSIIDTEEIYQKIKTLYPTAILDNKICNATTVRQQVVYEQEPVDLCIVVGDSTSSNTKKLVAASEKRGIKTVLIEQISDINKIDLKSIQTISITSGASTPSFLVDEIIDNLKRAS